MKFTTSTALMKQAFLSLSVSLGYFCIGMVRGYSSPAVPSILQRKPQLLPSTSITSWASSIPPFGAFLGSLLAAPMLFKFGRKRTLLITSPIWVIAWALVATSETWHQLVIGRYLMGFGAGIAIPSAQIYVSECSDPEIRGSFGSFPALAMSLGVLVTYVMGTYLSWNVLAWTCGSIASLVFVFVIFMPESPVWLKTKNRLEDAKKSVDWLQLSGFTLQDTNKDGTAAPVKDKFVSYKALFSRSCLLPLGIGMGLLIIQQVSGIDAVIFFTVQIFKDAGSSLDPYYATIIVGAIQLISNFGALFVVDKAGRKPLLIASGVIMSLSMACMGLAYYLNSIGNHSFGFLPLASLVSFMIGFSIGFGTIPYLLMGELFPTQQRGLLSSIAGSFNLLVMFLVIIGYHVLVDMISAAGTFWMYLAFCALGVLFVIFLVPETKGKELESIASLFIRKLSRRFSRRLSKPFDSTVTDGKDNKGFELTDVK